jgi:hypothetical protein
MLYVVCAYIVVCVSMLVFVPLVVQEKPKQIKVEKKLLGETAGEGMISPEHNPTIQS